MTATASVAAVVPEKNGVVVCSALTVLASVLATLSSCALVGGQRTGWARQAEQRAELAAGGFGERLRPVDGGAFDQRLGGVAEAHRVRVVGLLADGDLRQARELVEQHVAAVEHFVGLLAGFFGELDLSVELGDLVGVALPLRPRAR